MKIVCLSDTHGQHNYFGRRGHVAIPEGDVLIHAGDTTARGLYTETLAFINWMGNQPYKHKVLVAGNHDATFETNEFEMREYCQAAGIRYLRDDACVIEGYKFYGSPYTAQFFDWHFMEIENDLYQRWAKIPDDTDVLITHGPPLGILDHNSHAERTGSQALLDHVGRLLSLKLHVFGHIHEGRGQHRENGTEFVNAAFLDGSYLPYGTLQPVVDLGA